MVKRKNKKGSIDDLIFIIVGLLTISMLVLISFKVVDGFRDGLDDAGITDTNAVEFTDDIENMYSGSVDNGFLLLFIGLCIVTLVLASLVIVHPVFIVFYIIILMVLVIFGGIASNIYQEMAAHPDLIALSSQLTWTSHIMQYLPFLIGVFGTILAIIMYKAWENRQ